MTKSTFPDTEACKTCTIGSCCYEGAELSEKEMRRIIKYAPKAPKPWFRLVEQHEKPDGVHEFTTIVNNGTCVFQGKDNRCMVYEVRPHHCRDFPVEGDKAAPYYKELCVLFHEQWHPNSSMRKKLKRREKM